MPKRTIRSGNLSIFALNRSAMKRFILVLLLILLLLVSGALYFFERLERPYSGEIDLRGLNGEVRVYHDEYAIPHIYTERNEDAFRVLGYLHAADRLFQMDMLRRIGGGELSELLGPDLIDADKYLRTIGLSQQAQNATLRFSALSNGELKGEVQAYLEGVNAYIDEKKRPVEYYILDAWPEPFDLQDMNQILGYMAFSFTAELKTEPLLDFIYNRLGPNYFHDLSTEYYRGNTMIPVYGQDTTSDYTSLSEMTEEIQALMPFPRFEGSNAWVISGKKTKSGKVLFANDTHIGLSQPSVWYEAHIETPEFTIYGNFLAGIPYPLIGHSREHSWGLTIFPADQIDLFRVTLEGNNVLMGGTAVPLELKTEVIRVNDGTQEEFIIRSTPHGPILTDLEDVQKASISDLAMQWTANIATNRNLEALRLLCMKKGIDQAEKAASLITVPGLNLMYGDSEGNIAWWGACALTQRLPEENPKLVQDGSQPFTPVEFYDFSKNPRSINPSEGFVYSANNQPDSSGGLFFPGYYYNGARAHVIRETIASSDNWTVESMKELVLDHHAPYYPQYARTMIDELQKEDVTHLDIYDVLNLWDGGHDASNAGPVVYYELINALLEETMQDELGKEKLETYLSTSLYLRAIGPLINNENSPWWDDLNTPEKESRTDIFKRAFDKAAERLKVKYGADPATYRWDEAFEMVHPHPLGKVKPLDRVFNVGPYFAAGGQEVLNKLSFNPKSEGRFTGTSGPAMRILIDFSDVESSLSINPTGQSGHVLSDHYSDQAEMYAHGAFRMQDMNKERIKSSSNLLVFKP